MREMVKWLIILLLFVSCPSGKERPAGRGKHEPGMVLQRMAGQESKEKAKEPGTALPEGTGFFKGGYREIKNKRYGVYIVEKNDSVWVISKKVATQYSGKKEFQKSDVGNWFLKINLLNFATNFGGVKDVLKEGDKILIPLDE